MKTTSASVNGLRFGSTRWRMTRPRRSSVSPSAKTTAVNATGIDAGKGAACVTNSSRDSVPVKRSSGVGVSPRGPLYGYMPLTERASESTTPRRCWWASARSSPCRHAASAIRTPLNAMTTRAPTMASASRSSSRVNPRWRRLTASCPPPAFPTPAARPRSGA
ncbi:MAG: hypothetical protein DME03_10320 [Candidatus Rokuibacteriota bacterium]|nr:MAG: hypothetical protein DME03_10320 [Candidatus Rokubacteria bacterium]